MLENDLKLKIAIVEIRLAGLVAARNLSYLYYECYDALKIYWYSEIFRKIVWHTE